MPNALVSIKYSAVDNSGHPCAFATPNKCGHKSNLSGILKKEILVGAINGILWAVVVGGLTYIWFKDKVIKNGWYS